MLHRMGCASREPTMLTAYSACSTKETEHWSETTEAHQGTLQSLHQLWLQMLQIRRGESSSPEAASGGVLLKEPAAVLAKVYSTLCSAVVQHHTREELLVASCQVTQQGCGNRLRCCQRFLSHLVPELRGTLLRELSSPPAAARPSHPGCGQFTSDLSLAAAACTMSKSSWATWHGATSTPHTSTICTVASVHSRSKR